jgi:hypothetical protein
LILSLAMIFGTAAGALVYWATTSAPEAILGAGATTASAIVLFNKIISTTTNDIDD